MKELQAYYKLYTRAQNTKIRELNQIVYEQNEQIQD